MDKYLIGEFWWSGSLSFALGNIVADIVKEKGRCKQESRGGVVIRYYG